MRQYVRLLGVAVGATLLTGCVDRQYIIESDPPGAVVYVNGRQIGATPVQENFVYYGDYEFLIVKEGYETRRVVQNIPAPWYEYFPLDFFSENLWPCRELDVRRFKFSLNPLPAVRTDQLLEQAQNLRNRGQAIVPPATESPPAPTPPGVPAIVGGPAPGSGN
jgi:hypothetical protein